MRKRSIVANLCGDNVNKIVRWMPRLSLEVTLIEWWNGVVHTSAWMVCTP